jgi:hypothetical protein
MNKFPYGEANRLVNVYILIGLIINIKHNHTINIYLPWHKISLTYNIHLMYIDIKKYSSACNSYTY